MTQIIITLEKYDNHQTILHKSNILDQFPESLFGLICVQDREAKEISISNDSVTPEVMKIVEVLIEKKSDFKTYIHVLQPINNIVVQKWCHLASKYLLIPELNLFSNSLSIFFPQIDKNWLNLNYIKSHYLNLILLAMNKGYKEYIEYLLNHESIEISYDDIAYFALDCRQSWIVQRLIKQKKVDFASLTKYISDGCYSHTNKRMRFLSIYILTSDSPNESVLQLKAQYPKFMNTYINGLKSHIKPVIPSDLEYKPELFQFLLS